MEAQGFVFTAHLAHHFDDVERTAGSLATPVELFANAAGIGLFLIFNEEDLVNDGDRFFESKMLKSFGHGSGNEIGVSSAAPDDTTESDDTIRGFFFDEGLGDDKYVFEDKMNMEGRRLRCSMTKMFSTTKWI